MRNKKKTKLKSVITSTAFKIGGALALLFPLVVMIIGKIKLRKTKSLLGKEGDRPENLHYIVANRVAHALGLHVDTPIHEKWHEYEEEAIDALNLLKMNVDWAIVSKLYYTEEVTDKRNLTSDLTKYLSSDDLSKIKLFKGFLKNQNHWNDNIPDVSLHTPWQDMISRQVSNINATERKSIKTVLV